MSDLICDLIENCYCVRQQGECLACQSKKEIERLIKERDAFEGMMCEPSCAAPQLALDLETAQSRLSRAEAVVEAARFAAATLDSAAEIFEGPEECDPTEATDSLCCPLCMEGGCINWKLDRLNAALTAYDRGSD